MDKLQHIIIGGSPRSGSTALARLLGMHKDFMVTNEFGIYNGWNDPNKWKGFEQAKDFDSFKANEEIFDSKDFDLYDFRQVVIDNKMSGKQAFSLLYENISAKYYGDKCPMSYLEKIPEHLVAFPNAKAVLTLRDGRDVITSQILNYERFGNKAHWMQPTVEEAQSLWLECAHKTKKRIKELSDERLFLFRYEEAPLEKLASFIDPEIEIPNSFYEPKIGTWKEKHPDMLNRLSDEFKEMLEYFEYL